MVTAIWGASFFWWVFWRSSSMLSNRVPRAIVHDVNGAIVITSPNFAMTDLQSVDVRFRYWPCENSHAVSGRRTSRMKDAFQGLNHAARLRRHTVLENCIFHISSMYEFSHSQG